MSLTFPSSKSAAAGGSYFEISHHYLVLDVALTGIRASLALLLSVRLLYIKCCTTSREP
jgi:hypothetical protein